MSWISFKKQKPSKNKNYLIAVILSSDAKQIDFYDVSYWNGKHFSYWDSYDDTTKYYHKNQIIAWMEISEYKIDNTM